MKFLIDFLDDFKTARLIRKNRESLSPMPLYKDPDTVKAAALYRSIWPKTPYTCCDDSHEAGFFQAFNIQEKRLMKAEKVISFYSKVLNWQDSSHDKNRESQGYGAAIVLKDCEDLPTTDNYANGLIHTWYFRAGGKMAREYFQEKANK